MTGVPVRGRGVECTVYSCRFACPPYSLSAAKDAPRVLLATPQKAGVCHVGVTDANDQGGPAHRYRLVIRAAAK